MPTATLSGRTPAQLGGGNTDPVAVRNLSTAAKAYVGFDPSLQPETADMVILPGELYNSPAGQALWVCTDDGVACSLIYNTSGSGVQLAGPTSVTAVAGQNYSSLFAQNVAINPSTLTTVLDKIDVSQYQSLILSMRTGYDNGTAFFRQGVVAIRVSWYGRDGTDLAGESFLFHPYGNGQVRLPVKGPLASIRLQTDAYTPSPAYATFLAVTATTTTLTREYASRPYGVGRVESGGMVWDAAYADLGYIQSLSYSTGGTTWYALPSYMGRVKIAYGLSAGSIAIHAGVFGIQATQNYPLFYSTATGDQTAELIAPGSPLFIELNNGTLRYTASYELAA